MAKKGWALALQGLGAGLQGQGPEFMRNQMVQDQIDEKERRQGLLQEAFQVQGALSAGKPWEAQDILLKRFDRLRADGIDTSDTMGLLKQIDAGDIEGALGEVTTLVDYGYASGELQAPQANAAMLPKTQIVDGQLVTIQPGGGSATASAIPGLDTSGPDADRALRERQIAVSEDTEARQAFKLSAGLEKVLLDSQQASIDRQGDAVNFNTIANEFETRADEFYGGVKMTVNEGLKALLGSQDEVTEFRRKINAIRVAEGIGQLPPGVASDKDIELVMSGQIRENAGPEQVASYLRGAAKAAQYAAGYNQMRVDFINKHRSGAGLNNAWRKMHKSSVLKRDVAAAEVYRAAMNKGISIEQATEMLGIDGELF